MLAALAQAAGTLPEPPGSGALLVRALVVLLGVCGAAWFVVRLARRVGPAAGTGALTVVARLPLEGRRAIYVVRVGSRQLVVGAGEGGGLTTLAELQPGELDPAALVRPATTFKEILARLRSGGAEQAVELAQRQDELPTQGGSDRREGERQNQHAEQRAGG